MSAGGIDLSLDLNLLMCDWKERELSNKTPSYLYVSKYSDPSSMVILISLCMS